MSYGTPEWQKWVLGEEEGIAQIKFACVIIITIKFKLKRHLLISMPPGPIRLSEPQSNLLLRLWTIDRGIGRCTLMAPLKSYSAKPSNSSTSPVRRLWF
jgi:hypothetical protein